MSNTKFKVDVSKLKKSLKQLKRSVPKKSNYDLPILAGVKITPKKDHIELLTTNLDRATKLKLDVEMESSGKPFVVKTRKLHKVLKSEKGTAKVKVNDDKATFTIKGIDYSLFLLEADDYPELPDVSNCPTVANIDKEQFVNLVYAMNNFILSDKKTTRESLTTIKFDDNNKAIGTNGYQMMVENNVGNVKEPFLLGGSYDIKKVRPTFKQFNGDTVKVKKFKSENEENEDWYIVTDKENNYSLYFTKMYENFPEYEAVIPEDNDIAIKFEDDSLDRLEKFANKIHKLTDRNSTEAIKFIFKTNGKAKLVSSDPEVGEMSTELDFEFNNVWGKGLEEPFEICFKAEWIANVLDVAYKEPLLLWLLDSETAGLFDDHKRNYIIMPISLNS